VARRGTTHNYQALEMLLAPLTILAFDELAASAYGNLRADL
jgi:predicted nucleic acid-binding protein